MKTSSLLDGRWEAGLGAPEVELTLHISGQRAEWLKAKVVFGAGPETRCPLPDHRLHRADQLLGAAFPSVDGRRGGLIQVCLRGSPHFIAVMIRVASFAVPNRPVSVTATAPRWKAGDHRSSYVRTAVLEANK